LGLPLFEVSLGAASYEEKFASFTALST